MENLRVLLLLSFLGACTTTKRIVLPSGNEGIAIQCPQSVNKCYEAAGENCPKGYKIFEKEELTNSLTNDFTFGIVDQYEMIIQCKS